jgi:hypothetical protein
MYQRLADNIFKMLIQINCAFEITYQYIRAFIQDEIHQAMLNYSSGDGIQ